MIADRQGNRLQGANAAAAVCYDQAIEAFNFYHGDPVAPLDQAAELAPDFTLARIAKAWMMALATEPAATAAARTIVADIAEPRGDARAASLLGALRPVLAGRWSESAARLDRHNAEHPLDMLAIQAGHLVDFYRAGSRSLRDRIARVLPKWSTDVPGYSVLLGMYAFGLEETGDFDRAEDTGRRALELQPLDCWAHHAVAHVMEMQGRPQDGIRWMMSREASWSAPENVFKVHNWWHRALWHLELDQVDEVFALYDGPIRGQRSPVALELVDAAALLWRLQLCGHDVGDRWIELATAWEQHADGSYAFNDWHAVMSLLGAGHDDAVAGIASRLRAATPEDSEAGRWAREIGLPLVEGFAAFGREDYHLAVERLHGVRHIANSFGGSHAQRDVIDWTLIEAAVRGGLSKFAEALAHERLAHKPHGRLARSFLARLTEAAN